MQLYKLNKCVISFKNDPATFLNGLTSNALDAPQNAFLNIHGRIMATFDQVQISQDEIWIVLNAHYVDMILEYLNMYAALSKVSIVQSEQQVYFDMDQDGSLNDSKNVIIPQAQGQIVISLHELESNVSEENFTLFRLKNHISLHGVDYTDEFVLNVNQTDFVSFTKGCFLGQEPVAKVHNRSKPTWKLVVRSESECSDEEKAKMTSKVKDVQTQDVRGFVFKKTSTKS